MSERVGTSGGGAPAESAEAVSYKAAGVDIAAGDLAVQLMREWVGRAQRPESVGSLGGFAGLFDASALKRYERPLLASATDGVGTKVALAQRLDIHDTIGLDLVAMVVDDLVVCGAEPLFMTDYICVGKVVPERVAQIVKGIAEGCVLAGCALVGGETAEHPGLLGPDEYDVAGAGTGVVEADAVLGAERVRAGDVVVAMASSGLHSNGYSLVRHVLLDRAGLEPDRHVEEFGRTLGEELLEPTKIYALDCLALARATEVHAYSHVTGGGLAANLARIIPSHLTARVDRSTWAPRPVFDLIRGAGGGVERAELERTLNMGVGMAAVLPPESVDTALATLTERGVDAWVAGSVTEAAEASGDSGTTGAGSVRLTGDYARL
ncbi:phosphoribosylformylglycinamidine cyclo-ligase [Streptomyces sp. AJS327]|uniref:phosphoribosylformylglycinamidine cyclo-ligase n=1 Tax=Streptomyces sp. AJS327 TaxID=2545265 RepID=UPI0015DEF042|nr:phosphoribosylformylglycinamidine cyclo-ligase [Streptomyces sp. AJS327]MBA0053589.1 phosphoribosylformylglycinamidine cyclo-ligase [Streptomyces sp. AJS327]